MKKNNYLLLTLLLACTILIGCNTQTAKAKTYDGTKFTCTDTTITVSDKKKAVLINKIGDKKMKANTTYYIKVTPMIKVGDTTVASDVVGTTYFYNYK